MRLSIEVPVFKGRFLRACIDSVFAQTSDAWTLSLVWDGGDAQSREILQQLEREGHPRVRVHFSERQGIAGARRLLTDRSEGEYILPLDDDDVLPSRAVERFLQVAAERPWASLIRARRVFIDEAGAVGGDDRWFPFGPRHFQRGMVTDVFNQAQPYAIRRSAYRRTRGWTGFADLLGAGEDCDIFLQLEEVAHFELIDEVLYHYRLHGERASHALTSAAAFEMWRRLCDAAILRIGLPLRRVNDVPPFDYERLPRPPVTLESVEFVVPTPDGPSAASLRQCGVAEEAMHHGPDERTWRMAGFRSTRRPLVCFVDHDVEIASRSALQALVAAIERADADLLVPRSLFPSVLLVRREVLAATGGFDECHVPPELQAVDFWIQARRRDFSCVEAAVEGLIDHAADRRPVDRTALRSKWRSHGGLVDAVPRSTSDASTAAGEGARRNRPAI